MAQASRDPSQVPGQVLEVKAEAEEEEASTQDNEGEAKEGV